MKAKDGVGMKSAYELAMERLEKRDGKMPAISEEQKRALAEVDRKLKADLAEIEIMSVPKLAEVQASGDLDKIQEAQDRKMTDIRKCRERADEDKTRIREGR